jgi:pimeloyl-ACP methyl ester carboxylesterase
MSPRPLWSAIGVALAAVGCAPPGPRAPVETTASMRTMVPVGRPLDGHISVLRAGDPHGVRLILVHGTPGSAEGWTDYLVDPPPGAEVLALDRPGFGASEPAEAVTSIERQAAAVAALLPDDGRPVVLLGHSLGGPIVAEVAAQHPGQVRAVVFLAASLDPGMEAIHPMQHVGAWPPVRALLPRVIRNANEELMALEPELRQLAPQLGRITAKVLIVHGTADDLVPLANVPYLQQRLTAARCVRTVLLEGRNHFLPWNSEAAVRHALQQALEERC